LPRGSSCGAGFDLHRPSELAPTAVRTSCVTSPTARSGVKSDAPVTNRRCARRRLRRCADQSCGLRMPRRPVRCGQRQRLPTPARGQAQRAGVLQAAGSGGRRWAATASFPEDLRVRACKRVALLGCHDSKRRAGPSRRDNGLHATPPGNGRRIPGQSKRSDRSCERRAAEAERKVAERVGVCRWPTRMRLRMKRVSTSPYLPTGSP